MTRILTSSLAGAASALALALSAAGAQSVPPAPSAQPKPLTLGEAARLAARQNAAAETARLRVGEAEARVQQRRADLRPNLSASLVESGHTLNSATFGFNFPSPPGQPPILDPRGEIIGPVNTLDVRARLSVPLYDPAARSRVSAARAAVNVSSADAATVAEQAATNAASAYVRAERAEAQVRSRGEDSTLAADLLRIAQEQLRAGVGVALDVTRARSQLATVRAQLIAARNERDRARLELVRAIGLPADTRVVLADSLADSLADEPAERGMLDEQAAIARALRGRPDLRAAEEQIRAAERQVLATRAERLPTLSAVGDNGTIATNNNGRFLSTYMWGVQLSLPIYEGGRRQGHIEEQELVRREAEVRRRDLRDQAATEVRQSLLDIASAREQVDAMRERLQLAEQELAQARDRFRAGVAGNADVITASLSLNAARTQLNDALASWQLARVGLARAQGAVSELR